jgi:RNA polymerase sigma-70 factor (ECF subfamily)
VKAAIDFGQARPAFSRKNVVLPRRSQRKSQRLTYETSSSFRPEYALQDLTTCKPERLSLCETIRLAQQGDAAAFEVIYRLHSSRVYSICLRMLRDPAEAEDLTQESFIQLFRKIHNFRGESAFSTWLHRLTVNLVLMRLRKKKLVSTSLDEITGSDEEDDKPRNEIGAADPRLSGLVDRVDLQSAVDQLPDGYRQIFILYDVLGFDHTEIAEILGCSIGNSKSQLHKARKRLRELLQRAKRYGRAENHEAANHSPVLVASY